MATADTSSLSIKKSRSAYENNRTSTISVLITLMALAFRQGPETFALGWRTSMQQLARFARCWWWRCCWRALPRHCSPIRWLRIGSQIQRVGVAIGLAWLAARILTPGGSIIGMPLIAALYKAGVGVSILMTYAVSMATLSLMRIPLEVGFYGWRLTGIRVAVSLVLRSLPGC